MSIPENRDTFPPSWTLPRVLAPVMLSAEMQRKRPGHRTPWRVRRAVDLVVNLPFAKKLRFQLKAGSRILGLEGAQNTMGLGYPLTPHIWPAAVPACGHPHRMGTIINLRASGKR